MEVLATSILSIAEQNRDRSAHALKDSIFPTSNVYHNLRVPVIAEDPIVVLLHNRRTCGFSAAL